jgi:hypothetical protein
VSLGQRPDVKYLGKGVTKKTTGKPNIQTAFRDMVIAEIRKLVSTLG